MRRSITLLTVLAGLAVPASADAFRFTLVHPPAGITSVERAISFQVNRQVARAWPLDPISFGAGGVTVYFASEAAVQNAWNQSGGGDTGGGIAGFHLYDGATGRRTIWVWRSATRAFWTDTLSHEIIETAVDPNANVPHREIADPAEGLGYRLFGVAVAGWMLPSGSPFVSGSPTGLRRPGHVANAHLAVLTAH
ncbi:MAG TPA: hypothetical protein VIK30_13875 [Polyangia bacterium]